MTRNGAPAARPATEETRPVRRGLRRTLAALATLALGAGLAVVGAAAPASAHHNTISGAVACDADGSASIEWTVVNSESRIEEITASSNPAVVPVGAKLGKNEVAEFTQDDVAPGSYTLKLSAKWSNGATSTNQSDPVKVAAGQCDEQPTVKKITFCHATGSASNPYVRLTTSVNAFFNAGHIDHQNHGDIYPAFSYMKKGKKIDVPAQGDQRILELGCTTPTKVAIPAAPGIVDQCGVADDRIVRPADTAALAWTVTPVVGGKATAKVTAKQGYVFADGTSEHTFEFTFTDVPCVTEIPVPAQPAIVDQCGIDGDSVVTPTPSEGVEWTITPVSGLKATATATAKPGYVFAGGTTEVVFELAFTDEPCPPQAIVLSALPAPVEKCGVADDDVTLPSQQNVTWSIVSKVDGEIVVRATAGDGFVLAADGEFEGGKTRDFAFTFSTEPCPEVIEVPVQPASIDLCGVDRDAIVEPDAVEGVRWVIGEIVDGKATAVAHAEDGFAFAGGLTEVSFEFSFDDTECVQPSLDGSQAFAMCEANTPWIVFDVALIDPDGISTGNIAYLVLTDGTHTEKVELGELRADGTLDGRVLWPGAAVDEAGNPTAWPGWMQLPNGRWVVTEDNFGWTRNLTSATIEVNPVVSIDLAYPNAADCAPSSSPASSGDPTPIASGEGSGLASTGFAGGPLLYVAGGLVLLGAVVLAVTIIVRRKRA